MNTNLIPRRELGRFLALAQGRFENGEGPTQMFSGAVDAEWHQLLATPGYAAFSVEQAGAVLGHRESNGAGPVEWVTAYEEAYGPLPEIWFTDEQGEVDEEALSRYRETGEVVAEWDCAPTPGDSDDAGPGSR